VFSFRSGALVVRLSVLYIKAQYLLYYWYAGNGAHAK